MADVTVEELAKKIKVSAERLIEQLEAVGVTCDAGVKHPVTPDQMERLLKKLTEKHGDAPEKKAAKLTVTRRERQELKLRSSDSDQDKVVTVVTKRRRILRPVKPPEEVVVEEPVVEPEVAAPEEVVEEAPVEAAPAAAETSSEEAKVSEKTAAVEPEAAPTAEAPSEPATQAPTEPAASEDTRKKSKKKKRGGPAESPADEWGSARRAKKKDRKGSAKPVFRKSIDKSASSKHGFEKPVEPKVHEVQIPETITVSDLAQRMSIKGVEVIKNLMKMGVMATINQVIDQDTAALVVEEMGHTPVLQETESIESSIPQDYEGESVTRAPIVTIMGHVDHGKTSLLDYIRRTKVASGEAGGITQHIGAYHVDTPRGMVTFLDTPGHAAFSAMRSRGAKTTDVAVIVVAADDGVKPQTIEAIQHAKAAEAPIVIAVNKMDKDEADPDRVKNELAQHDIIPEDWGGDTQFVPVSAKTGQGIEELLESILLQAEVLELTAVENCPSTGVVIEASLDKGRGPLATVLVRNGTLKVGDCLLCGLEYGRVRAMTNERGESVKEAGPSIPVQIIGLSGTPSAGEATVVLPDERKAREIALFRQGKDREAKLARQQSAKLENFMGRMGEDEGEKRTLNIVLKADVQGSVEALAEALEKLSTDDVAVRLVGRGVGALNSSDVHLAIASEGILVGFNVRADASARRLVQQENISLYYFSIIYDVIDAVKKAITGLEAPKFREKITGLAEVRDVFRASKLGAIAGCMVVEGTVKRNKPIRVLRDSVVIYEGALESLRRFKDDVNEVKSGIECGIGVKNYNDIKVGDQIEVYEVEKVTPEMSD